MLKQIGTQAKDAAAEIAVLSTDKKNKILQSMACLLYTSPSPRDMRRSRMPSSA